MERRQFLKALIIAPIAVKITPIIKLTAPETTAIPTTPTCFLPGEIWINNRTGELFQVTSINSNTRFINITRGEA